MDGLRYIGNFLICGNALILFSVITSSGACWVVARIRRDATEINQVIVSGMFLILNIAVIPAALWMACYGPIHISRI